MSCALAPPSPNVLPATLADWRHTLGSHYLRLGHALRQLRFMAVLPDRSMRMIANRASPEIVSRIKAYGRVLGVLDIFTGPAQHAEIGISVEDAYQGRGFGRALFLDGQAAAERIGVRTADLYFASENNGIRRLFNAAGGHTIQQGPACEVHSNIAKCDASTDVPGNGRAVFPVPHHKMPGSRILPGQH